MEGAPVRTIEMVRKDAKLTQTEFGARIGVTGQTVYYWENGLRLPTILHLRTISREFGVSLDDLDAEGPYLRNGTPARRKAMRKSYGD